MSDTAENESEKNKGFHIDNKGFHCIPCRCKRQLYKETKTVKEKDKVTTNTVVDKKKPEIWRSECFA